VDFLEVDAITADFKEIEEKGYYTVNCNPNPSEQEVWAIENSVGKNELCGDFQPDTCQKIFQLGTIPEGNPASIKGRWKEFMDIGINVALTLPILPLLMLTSLLSWMLISCPDLRM
jgi:hypothetical protein